MESSRAQHPSRGRAGTTLVELMVAVVIMSVGILGLFGAFKYIAKSLFVSRAQTLATNLAQEKIEVLKNSTYYDLLLSTATGTIPNFPTSLYDTVNYPPESIAISNINFTRYTYVTMADVSSGTIVSVASNYPDTGLKQIVVNVVWTSNGSPKKWTLTNLLENPSVNPLDATIKGSVAITGGGGALAGAYVRVEQDTDWSATTNVNGNYSFQIYHGTYTVRASSAGFYDEVSSTSFIAREATANINFSLEKISTGSVTGTAWYNPDLVISQVVADTYTMADDGAMHDIEYIELFNPTTFPINIGNTGDLYPNKPTTLVYEPPSCAPATTCHYDLPKTQFGGSWTFDMVNVSTYVAPGHYYLYANAPSFYINGNLITADAYYDSAKTHPKYILNTSAGGVWIFHGTSGQPTADMVGWKDSGGTTWPPFDEGTPLANPAGMQLVRVSSPAASNADLSNYGRAYNSQNNTNDFLYPPPASTDFVPPKTTASGSFGVISGRVPSGVLVSASDEHSAAVTAYSTTISSGALSLPYVPFTLTGVTTGSYSVVLSYANGGNVYSQIVQNVTITQNQTVGIPNATTSPSWSPANSYQVQLTSTPDGGFVDGTVTDIYNTPLANIPVQAAGVTKMTSSSGQYFMNVSSGSFGLTANPNNYGSSNSSYVQLVTPVTVSQGAVTTQNFVLSLGARLTGYITTGTTPVPNQVVNALVGGNQMATGTSNTTGVFSINNVSTGTYTIVPVIGTGQATTPASFSVTVNSTGSVFVGTFTVTGAFGSISGTVTDNSALVTTGALIIASTGTISSTPPTITASAAPSQTPVYMISSKADGSYSLPVRGSATYNLSVYVPTVSNSGAVTISTKTYSGITVGVGANVVKAVILP